MATISSCLIVKNEMPHIIDLIKQLRNFSHQIVIVDTGSTDGTYDAVYQYIRSKIGEPPIELYKYAWKDDFADARNFSFSKATKDIIFWCDGDDVLSENLVKYLHSLEYKDADEIPDVISIPYKYWLDRDMMFHKERLFKRKNNPTWSGRIHEAVPVDVNTVYPLEDDGCFISHDHQRPTLGDRNLRIYEIIDKNCELDSVRDLYYYGMEMFNAGRFIPAYLTLQECARDPHSTIRDRINSIKTMRLIQLEYTQYKFTDELLTIIPDILKDYHDQPELYTILADLYRDDHQWAKAYLLYKRAFTLPPVSSSDNFLYDDNYRTYYPVMNMIYLIKDHPEVSSDSIRELISKLDSQVSGPNIEFLKQEFNYV